MTPSEPTPWQEPDLNAMLTRALKCFGNREAMYNGDETVTYSTLFRRAVALSCFIDEAARKTADEAVRGASGSVVLYLPSGLIALRSLLAVSLTGRTAVPVDALARARRTPGADPATRFKERELADLRSLSSPVRLILTVTPLARYLDQMKNDCGLKADCPVLFADEAANRMDDTHQEMIRTRLANALAGKLGHTQPGDIAIEFGKAKRGKASSGLETTHGPRLTHSELMDAIAQAAQALPPIPEDGALVMTSTEDPITWTHGYLPALATGTRLNFMRFFYPTHVVQAIHADRVRSLLLSSGQYKALAQELKGNGTTPELRCLINEVPSPELIATWGEASSSAIMPVAIVR